MAFGIDPDCFDRSGEGANGTAAERAGLGIETELAYAVRAKRAGGVAYGGNRQSGPIDVATAVSAHGGPHGRQDFETETFVIPILEVGKGSSSRGQGPNGAGFGDDGDPMFTLQSGAQHAIAFQENIRAEVTLSDIAKSLNSGGGKPGQGYPAIQQAMSVRRLTPRECERLQGFPDDFTLVRYNGKPAADGPRYRALGNAMACPVISWILARIRQFDAVVEH